MKAFKLLVISIIVLFLVMTLISALIPSTVRISRAIDINASPERIHAELADLNKWTAWNAFIQNMDEKKLYRDSILGGTLAVRKTRSTPDEVVTTWNEVKKDRSFTAGFNLIPHGSTVTLQWYFDFHFKWYPWEKFSSIVYDGQVGAPMQESLNKLKTITEQVQ